MKATVAMVTAAAPSVDRAKLTLSDSSCAGSTYRTFSRNSACSQLCLIGRDTKYMYN